MQSNEIEVSIYIIIRGLPICIFADIADTDITNIFFAHMSADTDISYIIFADMSICLFVRTKTSGHI